MFDPLQTLVAVVGGSGFIGRHVVRALAKHDFRIRVAVRRPDLAGHLQPLGKVGQIMPVQANVRYPGSLLAAMRGASIVINLAGVLTQSSRQTFEAVHVFGSGAVAEAARQAGARGLIHVSSLSADARSSCNYARTKAEGEARARAVFPEAVIVRPSVVFGPEDTLFNKLAAFARFSPVLPLVGGGETRLQPVFAGDVAEAILRLLTRPEASGRTYELGGPEILTMRQVAEFILTTVERRRLLVPLPWGLSKAMGTMLGLLPKPPLSADQVELLKADQVVSEAAKAAQATLEGLGIFPQAIEAIVPNYLYRYRKFGQFSVTRKTVGEL